MRATALLLALLLAGCDQYAAAQKADTIEAFEKYIADNPDGTYVFEARNRLEELYLEKAKKDRTPEAWDAYFASFPEGRNQAKAAEEREKFMFEWAQDQGTVEAWQRFLTMEPRAGKARRDMADRIVKVLSWPYLQLGEVRTDRINLAEDPNGPLNGWAFRVDVKNSGDKALTGVALTVAYLDAEGRTLDRKEWPLAAKFFPVPMPDAYYLPLKPGETRMWEWTSGDMPEGWSQKVKVYPSWIEFEGEAEAGKAGPPGAPR